MLLFVFKCQLLLREQLIMHGVSQFLCSAFLCTLTGVKSVQAQSSAAKAKQAQNEQQLSALQAQLTAAETAAQEAATAALEASDRIPALEHHLRRGEAKVAATNAQMSSLQNRLAEANRRIDSDAAATATLEMQLDLAQSQLATAAAAAQQRVLALPAAVQQGSGLAELRAVRAEAGAQQARLSTELAAAKAALVESQHKLKSAVLDNHRHREDYQADLHEAQNSLLADQDTLQQRCSPFLTMVYAFADCSKAMVENCVAWICHCTVCHIMCTGVFTYSVVI